MTRRIDPQRLDAQPRRDEYRPPQPPAPAIVPPLDILGPHSEASVTGSNESSGPTNNVSCGGISSGGVTSIACDPRAEQEAAEEARLQSKETPPQQKQKLVKKRLQLQG